jgi:imidazoleglycerol phosphate dehydratase HisB
MAKYLAIQLSIEAKKDLPPGRHHSVEHYGLFSVKVLLRKSFSI